MAERPKTPALPLLVGIDVGTTRTKAAVVGSDGRELAWGSVPTPWRQVPTGAETGPEELLGAVLGAAAKALESAPPGPVAAVGVTSMAEAAVWLDGAGRPVGPCIAWYDTRGRDDAQDLARAFGEEGFARRTGLPISAMCTLVKLRWLRAQGLSAPVSVQSVADWVVHALGGEQLAEASLACRTGALDVASRQWWGEALEWAGAGPGSFPPVAQAGEPAGKAVLGPAGSLPSSLPSWSLQGTGRLAGAWLTSAGHDHLCAAVGAGALSRAQVLDSCGTAEALVRAVAPLSAAGRARAVGRGFSAGWHVLAGHHALLTGGPLGMLLQRVLALLGVPGQAELDALDARAAGAQAGRLRVRSGGFFDDPRVEGLHAEVSPEALWSAALDEVGALAREELGALQELSGPAGELLLSGGWAHCEGLRRRKVGLLSRVRWPAVAEAGTRGAALLGGVAAGIFQGAAEFPVPEDRPLGVPGAPAA